MSEKRFTQTTPGWVQTPYPGYSARLSGKRLARILCLFFLAASLAHPVLAGVPGRDRTASVFSANAAKGSAQIGGGRTVYLPSILKIETGSWPTLAANPQRTSWGREEVSGNLPVLWYRPVEAYISQNVQLIAASGLIYAATSRGLYALNADNGEVAWRFDTQMPLGNSPTVDQGVVYVGGYDRKIHALDALTGKHFWSFDGAIAGFSTNPLVVEGKVIAGNRDGYMYAIGAHRTPNQGKLLWRTKTGGPIDLSAAYRNGIVYFASGDNCAYALDASSGALVWKSARLPGDGYHSYWPVIYQDKVIFSAASGYRAAVNPGTSSMNDGSGTPYMQIYEIERDDLFAGQPDGTLLGPVVPSQSWARGNQVIDASRITEYHENNPNNTAHTHKPWRRVLIVLNTANGAEYTFDSDRDGYRETIPVANWGTQSGNRYPPIVGPDGILYVGNIYEKLGIAQGKIMGWKLGTQFMSVLQGQGAIDEPNAISGGGNIVYRNLCCDRVGSWFSLSAPTRSGAIWHYGNTLSQMAPDYDMMWWGVESNDPIRLEGNFGTQNGIYHNHGDQNALIPYDGKLFVHRSNAILAFGRGSGPGKLPLLRTSPVEDQVRTPTTAELKERLGTEIQKMIEAGHLRPGYYNNGQFGYKELTDYFDNPGDTLYTLARAYPHLTPALQAQAREYMRSEFRAYFDPTMYAITGWAEGAPREAMPLPQEVQASLAASRKREEPGPRWPWRYPQHNFYAMWKYAQIFPADARRVYDLAKSELEVPVGGQATEDYLRQKPWVHNAYIAGYIGFLRLQELSGMTSADGQLRQAVTNELNRLLSLRANTFTKDTYWVHERYHFRSLNVARNFMMLVPELGDHLNQHALSKVREALAEYEFVAPYWFVSRYNAIVDEGVMQPLYDLNALFAAKAYIMKASRQELSRYLDAPAFERGDLFYIQNLVLAIEAQP